MAQKRMFDKGLLETDDFIDMPMSTKALYFLLGMEADDEGFVSPKRVIRLYGGGEDDIKVLISKGYVIKFESGVIVITDWNENNYLDKNRIKETKYQQEKKLLACTKNKYTLINQCLTDVKQPFNQYSIEESRVEENKIEENRTSSELSSQIKEIFTIFYKINPTINWGNKTSRKSAEFLIKKFGFDGTKKMAEQIVSVQGQPYCPTATTPHQMKEKLANFKIYFDRQKNNNKSVTFIS